MHERRLSKHDARFMTNTLVIIEGSSRIGEDVQEIKSLSFQQYSDKRAQACFYTLGVEGQHMCWNKGCLCVYGAFACRPLCLSAMSACPISKSTSTEAAWNRARIQA